MSTPATPATPEMLPQPSSGRCVVRVIVDAPGTLEKALRGAEFTDAVMRQTPTRHARACSLHV